MKQIIKTELAPAPIGPYSQAVRVGEAIYTSGQIAINPATGEMDMATLEIETRRVLRNLEAVLTASGASFGDVVMTSIFLSDMAHFATVNEIYATYFTHDFPARATVAVKTLPKNVNVEISVIAHLG